MKTRENRTYILLGFFTVLAVVALAIFWGWNFGGKSIVRSATQTNLVGISPSLTRSTINEPSTGTETKKANHESMLASIDHAWKMLAKGLAPADAQKVIEKMAADLWTGDPKQVGAAIRAFLKSGHDARTGLPFQVGEKCLAFAPSLRVALLDLLEHLDFGEALDYAAIVVSAMEQPDEVAVALRTLMHAPPGDAHRDLAIEGVDSLLQRNDWKAKPTGGYLESFDIATETDSPQIWKKLLNLTADDSAYAGTSSAAGLAAHTLAVRSPEFRALVADRETAPPMSPVIRGQLIARLDPRIPAELSALNAFVKDPTMKPEEAQAFVANFPSQRDLIGFRLLSDPESKVRPLDDAARLDIAANDAFKAWSSNGVARPMQPYISELLTRFDQIAASARKSL